MSQFTAPEAVQLFKKVYGDLKDLQPEDQLLAKDIAFQQSAKTGDSYVIAAVLSAETGWTLGGSGFDAFELNPAISGITKQATVQPSVTVLGSVVPWSVLSRSAGGGEKAFYDGTKYVVKNNLKSHGKLLEILRLYGQSSKKLGYVYYGTETFRDVAFTTGTGSLTVNGSSVAFTNGVNTSEKMILLGRDYASGIWVGSEGAIVHQLDSTGAIVASGKLVGTDAEVGVIVVDFTPVAASSTTSHRISFDGMEESKDAAGVHKILNTTGSLFGINNSTYSLWRGVQKSFSNVKLTFDRLQNVIASLVNRGGLDGDVMAYVNPRTWATLLSDQASKRQYDSSYKPAEVDNGSESIVFYHQAGKLVIKSHRMMMERDAAVLHAADWMRSGSAEIGFNIPGVGDREPIFPLENQAGMAFRSYADQFVFCNAPARSAWISGINDEANS